MLFGKIVKEFIFEEERPFQSCHASTLVALPGGDVLAAWFGGTREGAEDVAIWCAKRSRGVWSAPVKAADRENVVHWNPVLFRREDGRIFLYYKVGHPIPRWYTLVTTSGDNGCTWSEPVPLVEGDVGGRGPVKNKLIVLQDGTWLAPASIEGEFWDAFADISYDQGRTWTKSAMVPAKHPGQEYKGDMDPNTGKPLAFFERKGIIQPTLWESAPGHVHMLLRSTEASIYRSDSADGGKTWSPAYATSLPNNNSGIDLTKLPDGRLVLVYNPVRAPKGPRTPLSLAVSEDNGETWEDKMVLENAEGEYSYPAVISAGNELLLTYTWHRERIVFWNIEIMK